jgi:Flp pilus assembly protein TadD
MVLRSGADSIDYRATYRWIGLVMQVQGQGCMTGRMSAHNQITRLVFLLGLATVVMNCNRAFAQMSNSHTRPDPGYPWANTGAEHQGHPNFEDELDRGFGGQFTARQQHAVSDIVTPHELSHQVPGKAAKEYDRASKAVQKGDVEAAIRYFKKAIAIDPEFSAAINNLGTTYLRVNGIDLAIEQFNKAIAVDPHSATPYSNLAVAYLRQHQYSDAERTARRALDLSRAGAHGRLVLGISLVLQKKFTAEAEQNLRSAASDYPRANVWLAVGHLLTGDIATARDQLKMCLASGEKTSMDQAKALLQELDLVAQSNQ